MQDKIMELREEYSKTYEQWRKIVLEHVDKKCELEEKKILLQENITENINPDVREAIDKQKIRIIMNDEDIKKLNKEVSDLTLDVFRTNERVVILEKKLNFLDKLINFYTL